MRLKLPAAIVAASLVGVSLAGQTKITPPQNKYSIDDDVKLGQEAAADARQKFPMLKDEQVTSFVDAIGERLVAAIPPEFQQSKFVYTFETVNVSEINAFALPGGPMFVNRGMLEAATTEGEVAGVMAHEISHVVLRHGTAQASQGAKRVLPGIVGGVLGAVIGGRLGTVVNYGVQIFGEGYFTKFSREYEKQADIEGARIMALAGYDVVEMANMFDMLARESPNNNFEFLSDHPNPANRSEYIRKEAEQLPRGKPANPEDFRKVQARLKSMPKAPTTAEAERGSAARPDAAPSGNIPAPSGSFERYTIAKTFQISVPNNWRQSASQSSVTFAPAGAYGSYQGASIFTHGVQAGLVQSRSRNLREATDDLVAALTQSNNRMSRPSGYQNISLDGRAGLQTSLSNVSEATRTEEVIQLVTAFLNDGRLFYALAVAPRSDFRSYSPTFQRILGSVRLSS